MNSRVEGNLSGIRPKPPKEGKVASSVNKVDDLAAKVGVDDNGEISRRQLFRIAGGLAIAAVYAGGTRLFGGSTTTENGGTDGNAVNNTLLIDRSPTPETDNSLNQQAPQPERVPPPTDVTIFNRGSLGTPTGEEIASSQ